MFRFCSKPSFIDMCLIKFASPISAQPESIFNGKLSISIYYEGTFPYYTRVVVSLYLHCSNKNWCILHQHLTRLLRESDSEKRDTLRMRFKSEKDWKWGTLFFVKQTLPKQLAFFRRWRKSIVYCCPAAFLARWDLFSGQQGKSGLKCPQL